MSNEIVAVAGATGRTGRPLVSALVRRGAHVRALSWQPDREHLFGRDVEVRFGDLQAVDSLVDAFHGATSLHYIPPSLDARDPDYLRNIVTAAERAGVARIVYHSVLHSNTPEMPHHIRKAGCERLLRHSALSWTVIQPAMYVLTAMGFLDQEAGLLRPPFDTGQPFTLLYEEDLAEAAAIIHTTAGHEFATYELAGMERLKFVELAEQLSSLLGRVIVAEPVDARAYVADFAARRGLTAEQERERWLMFDYYNRHGLSGNGNVLRMLLGRSPTSFQDSVRRASGIQRAGHVG